MPTTVDIKNLKINKLTEAQYDTAVQGGVIGENELSVLTDAELEQIQVSALPTASADELGKIYQYIGATDSTYTNGYFYKCVSDGQTPATYSWEAVEVQASSGGLPDQTGNAGKFLTTDGTDASWSNKPLINQGANDGESIGIFMGSNNTCNNYSIAIGSGVSATGTSSIAIGGYNVKATMSETIAIGARAQATGDRSMCVGPRAQASGMYSVALGTGSIAFGNYAIELSASGPYFPRTNSDANTFKVGNQNGNFEMMSADGTIPTARLTKVNSTVTLTSAGWSSNTQTVNVTGMTATGVVMVSPDPTDQSAYTSAGILCTAQASGTLTFTCDTTPSGDIDVNVVML
jgi:hypothetical protein